MFFTVKKRTIQKMCIRDRGKYIRQERYAGSCSRSFYVGDVQPKEVSAKYEDGILRVSLPKRAERELPGSSKIEIE